MAVCLAALLFSVVIPATASAQAWVPAKGEGSVTVTYVNDYVRNHVSSTGQRNSALGRIRSQSTISSLEYGLTDKIALNLDLAHVASKYMGKTPHGPQDTGSYHPTFQDFRMELRYNAVKNPVVVTPFIGAIIPTHDYEVRGHAAVGRGFKQLLLGVNAGRQLGWKLRNVYVDGRYYYTIQRRFEDFKLNRSNADWEVGWVANRKLSLRFFGSWLSTHGGFPTGVGFHLDAHELEFHDRITRSKLVQLGGGTSFAVKGPLSIHAAYFTTTYARSTHAGGGPAIGISWNFSRGFNPGLRAAHSSPGNFGPLTQVY
jgi:hypothetical protein